MSIQLTTENISDEYEKLMYRTNILDNLVRVNKSRKYKIGIRLSFFPDSRELLEIHGLSGDGYIIEKIRNTYNIKEDEKIVFSFTICGHLVYTPLPNNPIYSSDILQKTDCLYCQ